jgi:hypothetical protein
MAAKKKTITRDSKTGLFVPPAEAKRRPATTERERVPVGKRGRGGR